MRLGVSWAQSDALTDENNPDIARSQNSKQNIELRKDVENFDEDEVRPPSPPHKLIADLSDETIEKITDGFAVRKLRFTVYIRTVSS